MPNRQREKGYRYERRTVEALADLGLEGVERVRGSGSWGHAVEGLSDDVTFRVGEVLFRVEVKAREGATGFRTLRRWKGEAGMLVLWEPRRRPLFVFEEHDLLRLIAAERFRAFQAGARSGTSELGKGEIA